MMDYTEFKEKVRTVLEGKLGKNAAVLIHTVQKLNMGELETFHIMEEGDDEGSATPNFYIKLLYSEYESGCTIDGIAEKVLRLYEKSREDFPKEERENVLERLKTYAGCRKYIYFRIVNTERNSSILGRRIHRSFLDLSMILYILVKCDGERIASVPLTGDMLKIWNVTEQEVFEQAVRNTPLLFPAKVSRMSDVINHFFGVPEDAENGNCMDVPCNFPIISNEKGINGFSAVFYKGVLGNLAKKLDSDFCILPSSTHEALVIPDKNGIDVNEMWEMVKEVNATTVSEEDFLSDNVYHYSREKGELKIMTAEVTVHV